MRSWGRVGQTNGQGGTWVQVDTAPSGDNSAVWFLTLIQTLRLNLGESPVYGNYGIPAQQAVIQQTFPDFFMAMTQQQFAAYFAGLTIQRVAGGPGANGPVYKARAVLFGGAPPLNATVPT
jgi:hypothetical protein